MQFAEQCPTEDEVAKRLATCKDWYAVIKSLPKPKADKPTRKRAPQSDRQDIADAINEREDRGENYSAKDIVEAVGGDVSTSTVARKQSAVRAERNAAPIEWDTIPGNQREKLEHTKTSILKQLEREYHTRLLAEADQYRAECDAALAEHKSKLDAEYKRLYDVRKEDYHRYREGIELQRAKGLITPDDYTLIRSCLHPDSRNAVTDGKLAAAFRVFNDSRIKVLLVKDK